MRHIGRLLATSILVFVATGLARVAYGQFCECGMAPLTVPPGNVGDPYVQVFRIVGTPFQCRGPWTWDIAGSVPPGLIFANSTLSGTPTTVGNYEFTVHAARPGGCGVGHVYTLLVTASPQVLAIVPSSGQASGGTPIAVTGTGFLPGITLTVGGVMAENIVVISATEIDASSPPLPAGTLDDVAVTNSPPLASAWLADFLDVPQGNDFHDDIEEIFRDGITAGYGNGYFGIKDSVTRAQMAVFLLKAEHGRDYAPPACTGVFADVECTPNPAFAVNWIEQIYLEGITSGCGVNALGQPIYCPDDPVTRAQMAVFLLTDEHGPGYAPPPCTGIFEDVECLPTPAFAVDWIEALYIEGVTSGCELSPLQYCPDDPVSRGQMAVFLTRTFAPTSAQSVELHADCFSCGVYGHACVMEFLPHDVSIHVGGTVTWSFAGSGDPFEPNRHSISGAGWDSGVLTGPFSYSHTFHQAGTFLYHCSVGHLVPSNQCPPLICCQTIQYESGVVIVGP
jgi:plastocyanin